MRIDRAGHQDRVAGPTPRGATTTRKRSSMVGQRSPSHAFTRLLVAIAVVAVAALLVATLWTGRPPRVEIRPGLPGIGRRTPIQVKLDDTGRVEKPDPSVATLELPVRLAPPSLAVLSGFHYAAQGGCEAVVYRVGEGAVRDGVQSGAWWFPGYPVPGPDRGQRFALFAIPYDAG